jgi:hypothetical protein
LSTAGEPQILSVRTETPVVGLYEKFELTIDLKANYANSFDVRDIDLWAEFEAPSGRKWRIWGFYNPSSWTSLWMVRFTPTEIGDWNFRVQVRDRDGTAESEPRHFSVQGSQHHGFVGIAPNNRYLRYSDGASFFGVGFWYNDGYEALGRGAITETELDRLKSRGVNFISFFPTPLETMGSGLGRYDENRCARMDQLFQWCEARDIHISWNLWFHSYISEAVWGGGNARYRNNPYRLVTDAASFFGSAEAWKYQEQLYRYIIARWGYSRALFLWFVVDEINGTEGWTIGDHAVAESWCAKVDQFFNQHDPYGRPTTGTKSGGIGEWWPEGYRIFDIAAREIYEAQGHPILRDGKAALDSESPLRYSYLNYAKQSQDLWSGFGKPSLIGECGWDHTYYEPAMPGYLALYHNALWVTLANGLAASPFWWAHSDLINDNLINNQLLYYARFVASIDFAALDPQPAKITVEGGDAWAMQSGSFVFGWIVHPRVSVANATFTISDLPDGSYEVLLYRTWRGQYLDPQRVECRNRQLTVTVPELTTTGGHASHIGNDVAFKIRPQP